MKQAKKSQENPQKSKSLMGGPKSAKKPAISSKDTKPSLPPRGNSSVEAPSLTEPTPLRAPQETIRVVSSYTEDLSVDHYRTVAPLKKGKDKHSYQQLLFTNICLSILTLLLLILWVWFLVVLINNKHTYHLPKGELRSMTELCQIKMKSPCYYYAGKYVADCKQMTCARMQTDIVANDKNDALTFTPRLPTSDKSDGNLFEAPNFAPCATNSWCIYGECTENRRQSRLTKLNSTSGTNGGWRTLCKFENADEKTSCFNNASYIVNDEYFSQCNPMDCSSYTSDPKKYAVQPDVFVKFALRICTKPLPSNGGQLCDPGDNAGVIAIQVCGCCNDVSSSTPAKSVPPTCLITHTGVPSCVHDEHRLYPNGYGCKTADDKHGYCYNGVCAPLRENVTCDDEFSVDPERII